MSKLLVLTDQTLERKEVLYQAGETIERQATANLTAEKYRELAGSIKKNTCAKLIQVRYTL